MAMQSNKQLFSEFVERLMNRKDYSAADQLVEPDVVSHNPFPGMPRGAEGLKETFRTFHAAFPDLCVETKDLIAEDDRVVGRFVATGTHKGEFMEHKPTGKPFCYEEVVIVRFRNGRIVEHWAVADSLPLLRAIGAAE
jgi:predicted ester cyclase